MNILSYPAIFKCTLFREVETHDIIRLLKQHSCRIRKHNSGSIVAFRGDTYSELWIIIKGQLRAEIQNHRGKVLIVETLHTGEVVASSILFAPHNYLPVTLVAEQETEICTIPKNEVINMFQENQNILLNYLHDTGARLSFLAEKLNMLQFETIKEKIAHFLLDESEKQGTESISLSLSRLELSELFGVTRPSLSREFSHLSEKGIIRSDGKLLHILKPIALVHMLKTD